MYLSIQVIIKFLLLPEVSTNKERDQWESDTIKHNSLGS